MGVMPALKAAATTTNRLTLVNADGRRTGGIPINSEVELPRGDLARILYEASENDAEFIFGDSIASMAQDDAGVDVTFQNDRQSSRPSAVLPIVGDPWRSLTIVFFPVLPVVPVLSVLLSQKRIHQPRSVLHNPTRERPPLPLVEVEPLAVCKITFLDNAQLADDRRIVDQEIDLGI
jgi:hypothetical protein